MTRKKLLLTRALGVFLTLGWIFGAPAGAAAPSAVSDCEFLLEKAEFSDDASVYDLCGFNNAQQVWGHWAPFVSSRGHKKGIFEVCRRYPAHAYGMMYCQKAADLGYGPALAYLGHLKMKEKRVDEALNYFSAALQTKSLSAAERGEIAGTLGLLYLDPQERYYDPSTGVALLKKAAAERSALANNILGVLTYSEKLGKDPNPQEVLQYFWRAILLDCPSAEENLGLFHLARLEKLPREEAVSYMQERLWSCVPPVPQAAAPVLSCDCADVLDRERIRRAQPYLLRESRADEAVLEDKDGRRVTVKVYDKLRERYIVAEIRKAAVILMEGGNRIILNLYEESPCLQHCREKPATKVRTPVKHYRISWTPQECADLLYYAAALLDTNLPFVGKDKCSFTPAAQALDEASALLLDAPASAAGGVAAPAPAPVSR